MESDEEWERNSWEEDWGAGCHKTIQQTKELPTIQTKRRPETLKPVADSVQFRWFLKRHGVTGSGGL